ncbi:DNA-binding FadR family transcriptional regulator [Nonomuraea thailandensis]|uniref:DNA-binding FadR family transcriptional regulator n=1 Tax=Nonomuraea thailandensis TaxID=1188745 RepID=A0A9X2GMC5_9ACTN|nr:FCD domain-containing protein [Nonomuraea thailandensis]MCP2360320.1 DNA-binding FadR family transcriptional regulator [Nonomuraea thailandensis]
MVRPIEVIAVDPVSDALSGLIRELGEGARLPPERELAERLGVSRTALRDRLRLLDAFGVLSRRQGSGTYVQRLDPQGLETALDLALSASHLTIESLHSVRVALERQAAREAARRGDPVAIAHVGKALAEMEAAADAEGIDRADFAFHQALLHATGNPALTFFADAMTGVLFRAVRQRRDRLKTHPRDKEVSVAAHRPLYEALLAGDADAAGQASDDHFQVWHDLFTHPRMERP